MRDVIGGGGAGLERFEANLRSAVVTFLLKKEHKALRQGKREKPMAAVTVLYRKQTV